LQFEKHTTSSGHEYFDNLLDAIEAKVPIKIFYQPYIYPDLSGLVRQTEFG
jgi:hypothetical protein